MKEVKSPKKPLIYYYSIILLIVLLFNLIVSPLLMKNQVTEVDYGTFMRMIEEKNIGEVEVEDDEILFTDKDKQQVYTTGAMDDPTLTQRLYDSGATFTKEIQKTMSPVLSFVLTAVLPLVIFIAIGQYMGKKLVESAGGKNSLMFGGTGKSGAKVYVQSTQGIHFEDVAGEDEAKESLAEIVDYLHNSQKYTDVGASMPKGVLLGGPPGSGATASSRPRKKHPASASSTRSTLSAKSVTISFPPTMSASRRSTSCSPKWMALRATTVSSSSPRRTGPNRSTRH